MTPQAAALAASRETVRQLADLIAAIDRRLPQVERSGESAIAESAVKLRTEAVQRISELEAEIAGWQSGDCQPLVS